MFEEFAKIARLSRDCVITEKIDGTNAQIHILTKVDLMLSGVNSSYIIAENLEGDIMLVGSRNRYITPAADNFGFAAWVKTHAEELFALGPGRHYGEWWGSGIQRGYGLTKGEKRFSLFNTARWSDERPACCYVVPVIYTGHFSTIAVDDALSKLRHEGSLAFPGFMNPEGVIIWHEAARVFFKKTLEKDEAPKSLPELLEVAKATFPSKYSSNKFDE